MISSLRLLTLNMVNSTSWVVWWLWWCTLTAVDFSGITVNECRTQRQRGEVDGVAVGAVAPFISSSDLEGVYRAGNQSVDGHCVGLTVHTRCTVHIWTLRDAEGHLVVTFVISCCQLGLGVMRLSVPCRSIEAGTQWCLRWACPAEAMREWQSLGLGWAGASWELYWELWESRQMYELDWTFLWERWLIGATSF